MARIIVKERGFETRNLPITDGNITIGRSSSNSIVLKNRYASGLHCEISCKGTNCELNDLGSTNGVFVNGAKVASRILTEGDKILVGTALLIYVADEEAIHLEGFIEQLQSEEPDERELAASLLGQFGTSAVADQLVEVLREDPESKVKAAAAEALGLVGDSTVAKALLPFFDSADTLVRNSVVRAIVRLADKEVVDGVAGYLKHENTKIRVLAAYTLGQTQSKDATKHLLKALDDDTFAVREATIKSLGDLGDPKSVEVLMRAAADPQRFPQVWVIDSLGKSRNSAPVPLIMKALKGYDPEVREAAANALGRLRAKESIPALIGALDDPDPTVRKATSISLEKLRRQIEAERELAESSAKTKETILFSSIGDREEGESPRTPLFGEDRSEWEKWWSAQTKA